MKRTATNKTRESNFIHPDPAPDPFRDEPLDRTEAAESNRQTDDDSPLANYSLPNPFFLAIGG